VSQKLLNLPIITGAQRHGQHITAVGRQSGDAWRRKAANAAPTGPEVNQQRFALAELCQ